MGTSKKSKSSGKAIDRPVKAQIARQAKALVDQYQVIVRLDVETGELIGRGVEIPNAIGFGATADEAIEEVRGNMRALVIYMLEIGQTPPLMGNTARTVQFNLRLTKFEKQTMQSLADASGLALSDYVRTAALGR